MAKNYVFIKDLDDASSINDETLVVTTESAWDEAFKSKLSDLELGVNANFSLWSSFQVVKRSPQALISGANKITFQSPAIFDVSSEYSFSNNSFEPDRSGLYHLTSIVHVSNSSWGLNNNIYSYFNSSAGGGYYGRKIYTIPEAGGKSFTICTDAVINISSGGNVYVSVLSPDTTTSVLSDLASITTVFSGVMIG